MSARLPLLALPLLAAPVLVPGPRAAERVPWGARGHEMAARAAVSVLPAAMPAFFREAASQLVWLDPEPDRWRERAYVEMEQAWYYDHFIDLENVPAGALDAPDRWAYLRAMYAAGRERPEREGFLPFRIVELHQRLVTEWRLWRSETDPARRRWIEQRIVGDAGILGHYVTDASQPQHATIHFNGWAEDAPNPRGYTSDRTFHARFESDFVEAHVTQADVSGRVRGAPRSLAGRVRAAVWEHVRASNAAVDELYRLEREHGFRARRPASPAARDFAAERLAVGARLLADLWWTAWEESAAPAPDRR